MAHETKEHRDRIVELATRGCSTRGFRAAIERTLAPKHDSHVTQISDDGEPFVDCDRCLLAEQMSEIGGLFPDAFRIDVERMEVLAYEVEVTHRVSAEKLEKYHRLWWLLDEDYWMLRLVIVDRFGNQHEIDLLESSTGDDPVAPELMSAMRRTMGIRRPGQTWEEHEAENPDPDPPTAPAAAAVAP